MEDNTVRDLLAQIDEGLRPVIEFNGQNEFVDFERGMRATCVGYTKTKVDDEVYELFLDFSKFVEFNKALEQPIWLDSHSHSKSYCLRWSETPNYPKDYKTKIYIDDQSYKDFKVLPLDNSKLFEEYQDSKTEKPYIEWLESKVLGLLGQN